MNVKLMVGLATLYVCIPANAANYLGGKEGLRGQGLLDVTNETTLADCVLTGAVHKTGTAALFLTNPQSPQGELLVNCGSVRLMATGDGASLAGLASAPGTRVAVDVAAAKTLTVGNASTSAGLIKRGAGTLAVTGGLSGAPVVLEDGVVQLVDADPNDVPVALASAGQTLSAERGVIAREGGAAPGTVVKDGLGTLALTPLPDDVTNVVVNAGTLRLYPGFVNGGNERPDVSIGNASFENASSSVDATYSTSAYPVGWTKSNDLEGHGGKVGMDKAGSPWCDQPGQTLPDGALEVFFKNDCSLGRNVSIPVRGRYRLSFWTHARSGYNGLLKVELGGLHIANTRTVDTTSRFCAYETPVIEAAENVALVFTGIYQPFAGKTESHVCLDDVKLSLIEAVPAESPHVNLANASFECSEPMTDGNASTNVIFAPTSAGWTFTGRSGIVEQFQTGMDDGQKRWLFTGDAPPDGRRMGFIGAAGGISQPLEIAEAGRYQIAFWLARPTRQTGPVTLNVALDGTTAQGGGAATPCDTSFRKWTCFADLAVGSHVLSISANETEGGDVLVDRVTVGRTAVSGMIDFEDAYADIETWTAGHPKDTGWVRVSPGETETLGGWTYGTPAASTSSVCGPFATKFGSGALYHGRVGVMLQGEATVSRDGIVLSEPGLYELSFMTRGRENYLGRVFEVVWNGLRLGKVTTSSTEWKRVTLQIVSTTANETGTLLFRGLNEATVTFSAYIDSIELRKLPDFSLSADPVLPAHAELSFADGAFLDLLFDGQVEVESVRRNGRRVSGTDHVISSNTCPEWVRGPGVLKVARKGIVFVVR